MELTATINTTLLFPTTPTPRSRNPIAISSKRPKNLFHLYSNPRNPHKKNPIFLTHCSTKPTISDDKDNVIKDQDSTISSDPNFNIQNPQKPNSNQHKSPPNSSIFSRGLVLDLGSETSWDSIEIGSPVVKRFLSDEEERWYMWYHGRSGVNLDPGSIGLAVSSNGIHWERGKGVVQSGSDVGLVLKSSSDWWSFDTNGVMPGEIVIMSSSKIRASNAVYWLYYTGFSNEKIEFLDNSLEFSLENPENGGKGKICRSLAGLAMSQDGRHWARIEGEHHSGSLFDLGSEGEWDSMFIASPQVVFHASGDLRMYYHSFDLEKGHFGIGMARSRDGMRWVKLGKIMGGGRIGNFDEYGVMNPCVVRDKKDGGYLMVYEGVGVDGKRCIGLALSSDGLKDWRRVEDGPVLKRAEENGCWDDGGVGSPCLVHMEGEDDEWRLYYTGIGRDGHTGIGMAVSEGKDVKNFRRWIGFHL
ncbi:hypothetical protein L6452_17864 [Arctium lappa]|uniref:Uncharacterized protein n=1 Tax=Arctium lappa TaxID=4217 RepID=A0ACB9C4F2_ARCLA|nr:hypothetical protein L6452_17864 [Arctium lappa]